MEIYLQGLKQDRKEQWKCISWFVSLALDLLYRRRANNRGTQQEWAFLPPPSNISEPVPSPSTVLFTPLAEYKSRVAFAQPYLILTHYTDLSQSHNVVLMRGEISDSVALGGTEAQVLAVRLQLFYNPSGEGGERERERFDLLEKFHEKPEEFDLDRLVATAWEL